MMSAHNHADTLNSESPPAFGYPPIARLADVPWETVQSLGPLPRKQVVLLAEGKPIISNPAQAVLARAGSVILAAVLSDANIPGDGRCSSHGAYPAGAPRSQGSADFGVFPNLLPVGTVLLQTPFDARKLAANARELLASAQAEQLMPFDQELARTDGGWEEPASGQAGNSKAGREMRGQE